jgi:hypothetical protein
VAGASGAASAVPAPPPSAGASSGFIWETWPLWLQVAVGLMVCLYIYGAYVLSRD